MLIHWIWFSTRPGLSDRGRAAVLQHFHDAEDIYYADPEAIACVEGLSAEACESLAEKDLKAAEEILSQCAKKDIHILTYQDAAYPARLKAISDPPVVLYYKGTLPELDALPVIAVVGTRKASAYGMTTAKRMGYQIATCGGVVLSGAADGIDSMAMRGALSAGGTVVAVLGCGADVVYPRSNRSLYADTQANGCLLTEFPPGTEPYSWNFPKRNRLISGLSCGVLVVEAPEKSGALITVRQAAEQGRDVFVVPGNIDVDTCKGSNALMRDGGIPISSGWDVLSEYEALFPGKIQDRCKPGRQVAYPDEVAKAQEETERNLPKVAQKPAVLAKTKANKKKEIDNGQVRPYIDAEDKRPALSQREEALVALLREGVTLVDDLIARSGEPAGAVLADLTMLEVKGIVTRLPGKRVAIK